MYTVAKNTEITLDIAKNAVEYNQRKKYDYDELGDYYDGKHAILRRKTKAGILSNNKVVVNHAEYIVDMLTGHLIGNPVEYQVDETKKLDIDPILQEYNEQSIATFDFELAENVGIYGVYFERVYADEDNNVRSALVDPRYCVCIYDDTVAHDKLAAVIYSMNEKNEIAELYILTKTEVVEYYRSADGLAIREVKPHNFKKVPVIEYSNTKKQKSDFEKVITGIDAYNILQSDRVNDKEQLVQSILVFYGFDLTEDLVQDLKLNRFLTSVPKDARAEYLTKTLNEDQVQILSKQLVDDIHKISKVPNMSDENFVGNSSGVALSYKLLPFEEKTKQKERFFSIGLQERFTLYNNYLVAAKEMKEIPAYEVDIIFKRNLPQNLLEISQVVTNLSGIVSKKSLLGLVPFVKNADDEVKAVNAESLKKFNQASAAFGTARPTPNTQQPSNTTDTTKQ